MTSVKGHRRKGKQVKAHSRKPQTPKGRHIQRLRKYARQEQRQRTSHHQQNSAPYWMQYDKLMIGASLHDK